MIEKIIPALEIFFCPEPNTIAEEVSRRTLGTEYEHEYDRGSEPGP